MIISLQTDFISRGLAARWTACEHVFVSREATILHADLDAFYASVEQRDDPRLRGRPVIVGGGVVLACSYEAKARGVKTAMGGRRALALCPEAVVVPVRFTAYSEASKAVFEIFRDTTPLVEGLSIDEAFLDVRGMRRIAGTPREMAVRLKRRVLEEVGLPITVGIATTKFLAKVASAVAKPDGLLEVPAGGELAFLHPLPVERLWGVGPVTAGKLNAHGVITVAQVARLSENALVSLLGRAAGRQLHALSHNRDPRRVRVGRRRRSIGAQCAIGWRPKSWATVDATLVGARRPARPAAARRSPGRPHGDAAPALRRLLARHALAHAARADGGDAHDPDHRPRPARGGDAADRGQGADARGRHARQPRAGRRAAAPAGSSAGARGRSTPRSTRARTLRSGCHHARGPARARRSLEVPLLPDLE